ncbi:MAG: sulfatase, partial [Gammaproteobacteria bacterium]|nr:sulfatase [Gammaproteobacteria bacterium]NIT63025.1 sulfatase [Gammaproteobacteria bacterium]NIV19979.1 sulfatase [Gammaproteobacteria bacterium]NIY31605.1 sulfatase [Gammaproteobacteria bacterium]
ETPVTLVDVYPTALEITGGKPAAEDADLPGYSLIDIAQGAQPDRAVLSEYHASNSTCGTFMTRHGSYKYVHYT